jgi:hypothetical protein
MTAPTGCLPATESLTKREPQSCGNAYRPWHRRAGGEHATLRKEKRRDQSVESAHVSGCELYSSLFGTRLACSAARRQPRFRHKQGGAAAQCRASLFVTEVPLTVLAAAHSVRWRQEIEIDRPGHRQIPGTIGMEKIDARGAAVGLELGPDSASGCIQRRGVEVSY